MLLQLLREEKEDFEKCSNGDIERLFYLRNPEFVLTISLDSEDNFREIIKTINEDSYR